MGYSLAHVEAAGNTKRRGLYPRGGEEFSRVLAFSDGLFAIAMTLLVVGVELPELSSPDVSELADALGDLETQIYSFFISFAVIGMYWLAHHRFIARLGSMDRGFIGLNLVYLALIAFFPFPTDLLGSYFHNPLAVGIYALAVCLISGMEAVLLRHAYRNDLLERRIDEDTYRWAMTLSTVPLLPFLISIPIAFASSTAAALTWLASLPLGKLIERRVPDGAAQLLGE